MRYVKGGNYYLWHQFGVLGRLAKVHPRNAFFRRYGVIYQVRRHMKLRGNMALEENFRDRLVEYTEFWTNGPHVHRSDEWFKPEYDVPKPHAFIRRKQKLLNTYQALRNLEIRR